MPYYKKCAELMKNTVLETERLLLRPLEMSDAEYIHRYAGEPEIAQMTLTVPHPYTRQHAVEFIQFAQNEMNSDKMYTFALVPKESGELIGCMGIGNDAVHRYGELGYWLGKPYWGQGYTTEAARRVIQFGFEVAQLNRIHASHFDDNPASGRVMQKVGMIYEGTMRKRWFRWDKYRDSVHYAILREDYEAVSSP